VKPDSPIRAEAIVVLGCRSSARLRRRVERGARTYRDGAAPLLLLSGGGGGCEAEAHSMRRLALAAGVPESALLLETQSGNTLGNAVECARLLRERGLQRVVLVSDRTHLPRAALLFRRAGLDVVTRLGVRPRSAVLEIRDAVREAAAFLAALIRMPRPRNPA
jgi:uncharacterized SAM-binding protein YcdF (DUF218 family)